MEQAQPDVSVPPQEEEQVGLALWTWHDGGTDGPSVMFDLDGVLSNAASRQHFLKGPRPDWPAFFAASAHDPLVSEVAVLLGLLSQDLAIVLLTARPARIRKETVEWLGRHELRWDLLVMRREGDYRPARTFKQAAVRDIRGRGFDLKLGLEDDLRNVEMFRAEGVPCLYIHSGYYD
jgi:hypothetical protein